MSESRKIQIWPSVSPETYKEIDEMAKKENRKFNDMAAILIEIAIKERKRKRKNAKEDSSSDNT